MKVPRSPQASRGLELSSRETGVLRAAVQKQTAPPTPVCSTPEERRALQEREARSSQQSAGSSGLPG